MLEACFYWSFRDSFSVRSSESDSNFFINSGHVCNLRYKVRFRKSFFWKKEKYLYLFFEAGTLVSFSSSFFTQHLPLFLQFRNRFLFRKPRVGLKHLINAKVPAPRSLSPWSSLPCLRNSSWRHFNSIFFEFSHF